jgi:hypothetical protein
MQMKISAGLVVAAATLASAHLTAGSLEPKGGETLKAGQVVTVKWAIEEQHNGGTDIALSTDGKTWTNQGGVTNRAVSTFQWTVPAKATATARLRICQKNGTVCTDGNNVSKPGGDSPYVLVSGNFTIQAATSARTAPGTGPGLALRFDAALRNVEVTLDAVAGERVVLEAFGASGRLRATLLDGALPAGRRTLSCFSSALDGSGPLLFKLRAGGRSLVQSWPAAH